MFKFLKKSTNDRKNPKSRKKLKVFLVVLLVLVSIGLLIFLNTSTLIVRNVVVKEGVGCVEADRISKDASFANQNIIFIQESLIEKKLKEKYLCIDSVGFKKEYPNTLNLYLREREKALKVGLIKGSPFIKLPEIKEATPSSESALITLDHSVYEASISGVYIADKNGFVFDAASVESDLPMIYLVGYETGLGRPIDKEVVNLSLQLINRLKELSMSYRTIKVMGDTVLVDGDMKLTFSLDKDLNRQLASLQLILQKAKMNSKSMDKIDLRFDKPVVIYSPQGKS